MTINWLRRRLDQSSPPCPEGVAVRCTPSGRVQPNRTPVRLPAGTLCGPHSGLEGLGWDTPIRLERPRVRLCDELADERALSLDAEEKVVSRPCVSHGPRPDAPGTPAASETGD